VTVPLPYFTFRPGRLPWLVFAALLSGSATLPAVTVEATLSSRFLVRGEQARLEITIAGDQPDGPPPTPKVDGLTLRSLDSGQPELRLLERRQLAYVFRYSVLSYDVGRHRIPAISVPVGGFPMETRALDLEVFASDQLSWIDVRNGRESMRCAAAFRVADDKPFENETIPVELKLYVPADLPVEDWGIPEFERDGLAVWRFEPNRMKSRVILNGKGHTGVSYPSTLTPTRSGSASIGPARVRLMTVRRIPDAFGFRSIESPLWIDVAATTLEARALPSGAPSGFRNAVGRFSIRSTCEIEEIREGDPVVVQLEVSGAGNLNSLAAPEPLDAPGWKPYEATPVPRGEERRAIEGKISFRQFLRPLEVQSQIPVFRLVYFDPDLEQYATALSEPIPLRVLPSTITSLSSTAPPPKASTPVERMTDILAALPAGQTGGTGRLPWQWLWHLIPGLIAAALLLRIAWRAIAPRLRRDPVRIARQQEFASLGRLSSNNRDFYRGIGAFIERWLGTQVAEDRDLAGIINDRDQRCFDPAIDDETVPGAERRRVMRTLRRHLTTLALASSLLWSAHPADAAEATDGTPLAAYDAGLYVDAARMWLAEAPYEELDATRLYDIGNCWYRLDSAGQAALYYRRALHRQPGHPEALQNLRFLERKFGSLSVKRPEYQYVLAKLPKHFWINLLFAGAWMIALGLLCFPATRPGSRIRVAAVTALVAAPIAAGVGGLGWRYYPDDARFAAPAEQAVVVADDAVLFTDANRSSPEVIDAPPGSLCRVVAERGRWVYVSFATRTRGWVPAEKVERLIPDAPPEPPSATRPRASDGST